MFNWNDLRVLLELGRVGSVTGAAKVLRVDNATVSRRLQALEEQLNARLVERTGGGIRLTPEGGVIFRHAEEMEKTAAAILEAARPDGGKTSGLVRVSTTRTMARLILYPVVEELAAAHPEVVIEIDENVQRIDLMKGQADLALSCYKDDHPRPIRQKLFVATGGLYASREYLAEHPAPTTRSLAGHKLLAVAEMNLQTGVDAWFERHVSGGDVLLRSSSVEELTRLCVEGRGVALIFNFRAADFPNLVRLPTFPDFHLPHHLITHPDLNHLGRVRAVKQAILKRCRALKPRLEGSGQVSQTVTA